NKTRSELVAVLLDSVPAILIANPGLPTQQMAELMKQCECFGAWTLFPVVHANCGQSFMNDGKPATIFQVHWFQIDEDALSLNPSSPLVASKGKGRPFLLPLDSNAESSPLPSCKFLWRLSL